MITLRDLAQTAGVNVGYDEKSDTVTVNGKSFKPGDVTARSMGLAYDETNFVHYVSDPQKFLTSVSPRRATVSTGDDRLNTGSVSYQSNTPVVSNANNGTQSVLAPIMQDTSTPDSYEIKTIHPLSIPSNPQDLSLSYNPATGKTIANYAVFFGLILLVLKLFGK